MLCGRLCSLPYYFQLMTYILSNGPQLCDQGQQTDRPFNDIGEPPWHSHRPTSHQPWTHLPTVFGTPALLYFWLTTNRLFLQHWRTPLVCITVLPCPRPSVDLQLMAKTFYWSPRTYGIAAPPLQYCALPQDPLLFSLFLLHGIAAPPFALPYHQVALIYIFVWEASWWFQKAAVIQAIFLKTGDLFPAIALTIEQLGVISLEVWSLTMSLTHK